MADFARGRWRGVLIRGPSGGGKSTLALRCLEAGFRLVADDRVVAWASGGRVWGKAPGPLAGLMEVRGLGILGAGHLSLAEIVLVADLVPAPERLAEPAQTAVAGLAAPLLELGLADPDLPLRLRAALQRHL